MKPAQRKLTFALAALTLILLAASNALAGQDGEAGKGKHGHDHGLADGSAFVTILSHYEGIRGELVTDKTDGLAKHARAIRSTVDRLTGDFSATSAGVHPDQTEAARDLLPIISKAADELAKTDDIGAAREALYALSKALVRYRKLATGDLPAVAYCPMLKKSWLQPSGEIGNPYYGQEMPTCGEIVDG